MVHRWREIATIKKAGAEDMLTKGQQSEGLIKGPPREGRGDNKESGRRGYIDHGPADGGKKRQ